MESNPFLHATVGEMLDVVAARYPDRDAIVATDERVTYAAFRERAATLARGLSALGVAPGDSVAIWMPNRPTWFIAQQACARLGAVVVALNPRYKAHELSYILAQSDATALILTDQRRGGPREARGRAGHGPPHPPTLGERWHSRTSSSTTVHSDEHLRNTDYFETLHAVAPEIRDGVPGELSCERLPSLRSVIVDAEDDYPGCVRFRDVMDAGAEAAMPPLPAPAPDDLFALLYTSGTTAFPKGAMITHRNCVPHGWNTGEQLRLTSDDRVLHALPAAGTWGGLNIPLSTWSHGACLVLMETFDALQAFHLIERERCTVWNGVDMMARAMLDHPELERFDLSTLRTGGFGAVGGGGHGLFEAVVERLGIPQLYQPYGMTEVNALSLWHDLDEPVELRALSGVKTPPGIDARVVHPETGRPCSPGEEGELQFRGMLVTPGYYKKPDETAAAFTRDGWFKTGDLAVRDEQGHVMFKGRLKETLRISHFMVAPGEIEAFLMSHPSVDQAFVVGVPDAVTNEAAVAFVILKEFATLGEDELRLFCRGKIASYKIPKVVHFVPDVPRTPGPHGDKVQRLKLREQALAEGAGDVSNRAL